MSFGGDVTTTCVWDNVDEKVRKKVNEIAQDEGRKSKGQVTFNNGTKCQHWRAGDYRIFGTFTGGKLTFIGWGQHVGKGNKAYAVNLCGGGTTRATTS